MVALGSLHGWVHLTQTSLLRPTPTAVWQLQFEVLAFFNLHLILLVALLDLQVPAGLHFCAHGRNIWISHQESICVWEQSCNAIRRDFICISWSRVFLWCFGPIGQPLLNVWCYYVLCLVKEREIELLFDDLTAAAVPLTHRSHLSLGNRGSASRRFCQESNLAAVVLWRWLYTIT